MLRLISISLALVAPASAVASVQQLRDEASAYAGKPVRLDERLAVPNCRSGFAFRSPGADLMEASCPETGWRMRIPLAASPPVNAPRRGQALRVEVEGAGYRATMEGIVESASARDGTVMLRNPRSGTRFVGRIQPDGRILANYPPAP